jgi:hypothetical protein
MQKWLLQNFPAGTAPIGSSRTVLSTLPNPSRKPHPTNPASQPTHNPTPHPIMAPTPTPIAHSIPNPTPRSTAIVSTHNADDDDFPQPKRPKLV